MESEVKQEASGWKIHNTSSWKIKIPRELYDKIFMYVKCIDKEIAGFGDVEVDAEKKEYHITKLMMFKQKVTGATVDFDSAHLGEMLAEAMSSGQDLSKTKFEWHSHANMNVFWSTTDEECCKTLLGCSRDFYIFFVVNKKGELLARVDYLVPLAGGTTQLTHLQIPVFVQEPACNELERIVKEDIEKFIDQSVPVVSSYGDRFSAYPYEASYPCGLCQRKEKKTRWNVDVKEWICQECEEDLTKDDEIAICPHCNGECIRDYSIIKQMYLYRCPTCQIIVETPKFLAKAQEIPEQESTKFHGVSWAKCEVCGEDKYCRYYALREQWMCSNCIVEDKKEMRAKRRADQENPSWCDETGRWWYWSTCDDCGTEVKDYVTWVKDESRKMCSDCYELYQLKKKEELCKEVI